MHVRREARLVDDHRYGVELSLAPTPVKSSQKNRPDAPYEGLPPNRWMPGTNAKYPLSPGWNNHVDVALAATGRQPMATAGVIPNVSQYDRKMPDAQRLLADRIAIDDLLTHYATLIDSRRFEELDQVFTFDAVLDYRSAGGIRGSFSEVRDWLASVLPMFSWTQHLVVNRAVELAPGADEATCRSLFHNPNSMEIEGRSWLFVVGGAYHDRLMRTDSGWRIRHRVEETIWWDNPMPGLDAVPPPLPADCFD